MSGAMARPVLGFKRDIRKRQIEGSTDATIRIIGPPFEDLVVTF